MFVFVCFCMLCLPIPSPGDSCTLASLQMEGKSHLSKQSICCGFTGHNHYPSIFLLPSLPPSLERYLDRGKGGGVHQSQRHPKKPVFWGSNENEMLFARRARWWGHLALIPRVCDELWSCLSPAMESFSADGLSRGTAATEGEAEEEKMRRGEKERQEEGNRSKWGKRRWERTNRTEKQMETVYNSNLFWNQWI